MDVVYIDDIVIDLKPNTTIALTLQRLEIGDITKNYLSFTNTIKAPKTAKNNAAFGFANVEKSNSSYQYGYKSARIVQNGVMTINGLALIKAVDNEYQINIYDNFISFNDFLGDKDLSSLSYGTQGWNNSDIDAARLNTTDFIAAVMNWGHSANVYVKDNYLPLYSYKTLIEKILTSIGYTLSGEILSNTDFTDLVCTPFYGFKYKTGYQKTTKPTDGTNDFGLAATTTIALPFATDVIPYRLRANITMRVGITINWVSRNIASTSYVRFFVDGTIAGTMVQSTDYTTNQGATIVFTANDVDTITAQTLRIRFSFFKDPAYPDVVNVQTNAFNSSIEVVDTLLVVRANPQWPRLASNIKLNDILKDFFVRFGIIYKKDFNNLTLRTLEDICTDTGNALDWTNKRVKNDGDSISFQTSYAQVNNFLHTNNAKSKFLGAGSLNVANTTLPQTKDFYSSPFNNSQRWAGTGYEVMSIPAYDPVAASAIDRLIDDVPLCIGTLKARTNEAAIIFDTIARTDYKLAYFVDASKSKDSSFSYFIGKYYATFGRSLQQFKLCTYRYLLTDMDIASYDPHKMIYDNGSYYLINKISNYVSGKPTTVELLKIQ